MDIHKDELIDVAETMHIRPNTDILSSDNE
jgi:hypothetical protein